jgi:hypothetical protein
MDIPKPTKFLAEWLPKSRRNIDLTEDMSAVRPFQLEGVRQYIDTTLLRLNNSLNVLNARNDASKRHGKRNPKFRSENLRLHREIDSLISLRPQIDKALQK